MKIYCIFCYRKPLFIKADNFRLALKIARALSR